MTVAAVTGWFGGVQFDLRTAATEELLVTTAVPTSPPPEELQLVVIGDSFSSVDWSPAGESGGWPALVAQRHGLQLVNLARGGAGYVRASATSFTYAASQVPTTADVVVVFGGLNDEGAALQNLADVTTAARAVVTTVHRLAPAAQLVVVGPQWPWAPPVRPVFLDMRDGVEAAALAAGARWVDPIGDGWFTDRPELIGPDGAHPSAAGQQFLADRIGAAVAAALTDRGAAAMLSPGHP